MYKSTLLVQLFIIFSVATIIHGSLWDSIVSVDRPDNETKKVGVHLPFIYWMDMNRNKQGPKLDISVLGGLVKVNIDRRKQANVGKRPVAVSVFGQSVYNSYPGGQAPNGELNIQDQPFQGQQQGQQEANNVLNIRPNVISYERPNENKAKPDRIIITETVTEPKYDIPPSELSSESSTAAAN